MSMLNKPLYEVSLLENARAEQERATFNGKAEADPCP